jgi:hypothetical protein
LQFLLQVAHAVLLGHASTVALVRQTASTGTSGGGKCKQEEERFWGRPRLPSSGSGTLQFLWLRATAADLAGTAGRIENGLGRVADAPALEAAGLLVDVDRQHGRMRKLAARVVALAGDGPGPLFDNGGKR